MSAAVAQQDRAQAHLAEHELSIHRRTDRLFAGLMVIQWIGAIVLAAWMSPRTWAGPVSEVHEASLMAAVKTCYNICLMSPDPTNQTTAKATLTQMLSITFSRFEQSGVRQPLCAPH